MEIIQIIFIVDNVAKIRNKVRNNLWELWQHQTALERLKYLKFEGVSLKIIPNGFTDVSKNDFKKEIGYRIQQSNKQSKTVCGPTVNNEDVAPSTSIRYYNIEQSCSKKLRSDVPLLEWREDREGFEKARVSCDDCGARQSI